NVKNIQVLSAPHQEKRLANQSFGASNHPLHLLEKDVVAFSHANPNPPITFEGTTLAPVAPLSKTKQKKRLHTVSVYGSARTKPGDGYYEHAQKVAKALGKAGISVITGGGPGSMRAVAEGVLKLPVRSLGLAMSFIGEKTSEDVHKRMMHFDNFFNRMSTFEKEGALTASVPGGIGTLMELTNIATKLSTGNTPWSLQKQIVLFDKNDVFKDFVNHLQKNFVDKGLMSQSAVNFFKVFDEDHIDEGVALLKSYQSFTEAV
ncbi:MAG: LOG family protein, partial [Cyanobacteria bacterium]|nr:LOG family protein [Cyanobacteriota bacterium]